MNAHTLEDAYKVALGRSVSSIIVLWRPAPPESVTGSRVEVFPHCYGTRMNRETRVDAETKDVLGMFSVPVAGVLRSHNFFRELQLLGERVERRRKKKPVARDFGIGRPL